MTTLTSLCRLRSLAGARVVDRPGRIHQPRGRRRGGRPGQGRRRHDAPARTRMGTGYLRLAYLSPDSRAVDVYLYSFGRAGAAAVFRHVNYGTISRYRTMTSGDYTVAMREAGAAATTRPALSATLDVTAGDAYTVAGLDPQTGPRFQVITDRLELPAGPGPDPGDPGLAAPAPRQRDVRRAVAGARPGRLIRDAVPRGATGHLHRPRRGRQRAGQVPDHPGRGQHRHPAGVRPAPANWPSTP